MFGFVLQQHTTDFFSLSLRTMCAQKVRMQLLRSISVQSFQERKRIISKLNTFIQVNLTKHALLHLTLHSEKLTDRHTFLHVWLCMCSPY